MRLRRWTSSHPTIVLTNKRQVAEAQADSRECRTQYEHLLDRTDRLHLRLMQAEESLMNTANAISQLIEELAACRERDDG